MVSETPTNVQVIFLSLLRQRAETFVPAPTFCMDLCRRLDRLLPGQEVFWTGGEKTDRYQMFIGILSDTHDHLPLIARAVKTLNEEGVELVLHAGDYVSPFVMPSLRELKAPVVGVFGNNDGDRELIRRRASEKEGFEIRGDFALLEVQGTRIALMHGSDRDLTEALKRHGGLHVLVHGHTHHASIERGEGPLVVNPGEACGYLSGTPTIAILETEGLEADIIEL